VKHSIEIEEKEVWLICHKPPIPESQHTGPSILDQLINRNDIPSEVSLKLGRLAYELEKEYSILNKNRNKIVEKHTNDEKHLNQTAATEEWEKLLADNIFQLTFKKIPISLFKGLNIKPALFTRLHFFFLDEDE